MGARVYHVTFTRTLSTYVLAETEDDIKEAVATEDPNNGHWDLPDWDYEYCDLYKVRPLPRDLPMFDAVVIREGERRFIVSAQDDGVAELRAKAEKELDRLHMESRQLSLFRLAK